MSEIITVFKSQLKEKPGVINIIEIISVDIKKIVDAYVFSPKAGHLYELLNCLNENGVDYRTHFRETLKFPLRIIGGGASTKIKLA